MTVNFFLDETMLLPGFPGLAGVLPLSVLGNKIQ